MKNKYAGQDRGDISAYESYFKGMNASMQQKIALTTAHFPSRGAIADMGSGSGSGTFDLARLYEDLELVGIDINPVTVDYSCNTYEAENLRYIVGDIAEKVLADESLAGILNSSVLHHVTSFNDYEIEQIAKTLKNQVAQLKPGGVLIIRDFVVPDEAEKSVFLDLPETDGKAFGEISELSSAALFEVFARDFRCSLNRDEGVPYRRLPSPRVGFKRFETTLRYAAEFVLRKDYRKDWAAELIEEYTYYSQKEFEAAFRRENLRIVVSMPLWNPWIVGNRFAGKFYLSGAGEKPLVFPPTNYLIAGEKVAPHEGVRITENEPETAVFKFLKLKACRHRETGQIFELAERPNRTIDLLPWFENDTGRIFILAKKDFPRPLVNAQERRPNLNRANYSGYLTEPLSAIVNREDAKPPGEIKTDSEPSASPRPGGEIRQILATRANLTEEEILEIGAPHFYYPSPGGVDEMVAAYPVRIENWEKEPQEIENYTPFASAGFVRELDALQVLRACAVGGMFDARLEINIYRLLRKLGRSPGVWIGAEIKPSIQTPPDGFAVSEIEKLSPEKRAVFAPFELAENEFLALRRSGFTEENSASESIARAEFEYVVPQNYSKNTVAAIPFFKTQDAVYVGIEFRDLPAPQRFSGSSRLACTPAWRLPSAIEHKFDLEDFLREKLPKDFGVEPNKLRELGGTYFPSAGVTPEIVYPLAVELKAESLTETDLYFFRIEDLLEKSDEIDDAHLLILLNRLAHALGRFD
jgi:SAM-dependent methyltransferase